MRVLYTLVTACMCIVHLYAAEEGQGALRVYPSVKAEGGGEAKEVFPFLERKEGKGIQEYAVEGT